VEASAGLTLLTRLGFAARGLLYLVIAYLLIRIGRAESPSGALDYLAEGGGKMLLAAMIAGFAAYGLWRLADALFNVEHHEAGKKGLRERLGAGASGVVHLLLAWQALRLLRGAPSDGGGSEAGAKDALSLPGGEVALMLAGAVLIGVGLFQIVKAYKCSFLRHLEAGVANRPWAKWIGRAGYGARGIVFMISGYFLVRAGLHERAAEAGGIDEALAWLSDPWNMIVAAGLFGFGLYSLIEARFRVLHGVPAARAMGRLRL
jgi:hypothetical protein